MCVCVCACLCVCVDRDTLACLLSDCVTSLLLSGHNSSCRKETSEPSDC